MKRPVIVHTITQKGKGYAPAEEHPKLFHGVGKFNAETGEVANSNKETFSSAFGSAMVELAAKNEKICAITAAMPGGTGLLEFKKQYPTRMFDVGIAEEHAVSMAGGLAKQGMTPVVAVYSTFLQRAYDMILQDVALQNLHVVFAVDRAGLVGEDGETHHGVFDVGFLRQAPGMRILCPGSCAELQSMLDWSANQNNGPVAIRYPRGGDQEYHANAWLDTQKMVCCHKTGKHAALVVYGPFLQNVMEAASQLEKEGISVSVIRLLQINPIPAEELFELIPENMPVFILEEVSANSGIRESIAWMSRCKKNANPIYGMDLGYKFITHGAVSELYKQAGLDPNSIVQYVQEVLKDEN